MTTKSFPTDPVSTTFSGWRSPTLTTAVATLLSIAGTACHDDPPPTATMLQASIGQCQRDEGVLRGEPGLCAVDADCPCGSFCDPVEHECTFECMVPPANDGETCAAGTQCNDTGRCVGASTLPPPKGPTLSASPPVAALPPGSTASQPLQVRLSMVLATGSTERNTTVRIIGRDGVDVSCDATTYGDECRLTDWTFQFQRDRYVATKTIRVQNEATNSDGGGRVLLRIDATETEMVVPVVPSVTAALAGIYAGTAVSSGIVNGVTVDARIHGNYVIVRDPSRVIAPDGALVLDLLTSATSVATARRMPWLMPVGATSAPGVGGEYKASAPITSDPAKGMVSVPFTITLPGNHVDTWTLQLNRAGDHVAECTRDADCGAGKLCPTELEACVPAAVWQPATVPLENQFEDARSLAWWDAVDDLLGTGETLPAGAVQAFATTGADLIESLMCSIDATQGSTDPFELGTARLAPTQVKFASNPSKSGDLRCVRGLGNGSATATPGPVGLLTYADREGESESVSSALLPRCLADLARTATSDWASNFGQNVGKCANLARFVPALRLLATGERQKATKANDPRTRGLLVRLLQQWSSLHGFIASVGLSEREYDDAISGTPDETTQELTKLLDTLDAGWATILDRRIAPSVAASAAAAPTGSASYDKDYRLAKQPIYYWTFNGTNADMMRQVPLTQQSNDSRQTCRILTSRNSIKQDLNCPGFRAVLPAEAPSIATGGNMTVVFNIDEYDSEFPSQNTGGTVVATETLAISTRPLQSDRGLIISHPAANGGVEHVFFDGLTFGYWTASNPGGGDGPFRGTSVAVVRDTVAMTYTVYAWESEFWSTHTPSLAIRTQRYYHTVSGKLPGSTTRNILVGAGTWPNPKSFHGYIDDIAIFNSRLSKRELGRFGKARSINDNGRHVWPQDMALTDTETAEIGSAVGASLLETQAAHLEVATRFTEHAQHQSVVACATDNQDARAARDAVIARVGRTVRQSVVIESLAKTDTSDRANKARQLIRVKRSEIARLLRRLSDCRDPYGMAADEVPLYFGDINADQDEVAAFFAASDHLLPLALQRADAAVAQLTLVRSYWDQARQSKIQQLQDVNSRSTRVDEIKARYAGQLRQLCGLAGKTTEQIITDVLENRLSVDTCFIKPQESCMQHDANGPIMDANPECYQGALGTSLMDMRAASHAYDKAYQAWQAAVGNAEGAEKLCVLNEMDTFGCSALNRHELEGVTCPPNHQGTLELIAAYNTYRNEQRESAKWLDVIKTTVSMVATVVATAATGPGGAFVGAAMTSLGMLGGEFEGAAARKETAHKFALDKRAAEMEIRACWTKAEEYSREIASAEAAQLESLAHMQSAILGFQNALAEARDLVAEAPVVLDRELNRPSLPLAFHYWVPEQYSHYRFLIETARRYAYVAMRATEYDTLATFTAANGEYPLRSTVVGAWRPETLRQQVLAMQSLTHPRETKEGRPAENHLVLDVGHHIFGLEEYASDFGAYLASHTKPVYSRTGEYLGEGVRFTFLPPSDNALPQWRCAERLWRANVAAVGVNDAMKVKLLKRNVFASRRCDGPGVDVYSVRPGHNLLISDGGSGTQPTNADPNTTAEIDVVNLDTPDALTRFKHEDNFTDGSSAELAGRGMYGDYILLFPAGNTPATRIPDLSAMDEVYLRFDFLSVDDTPTTDGFRGAPQVRLDKSSAPIVMD